MYYHLHHVPLLHQTISGENINSGVKGWARKEGLCRRWGPGEPAVWGGTGLGMSQMRLFLLALDHMAFKLWHWFLSPYKLRCLHSEGEVHSRVTPPVSITPYPRPVFGSRHSNFVPVAQTHMLIGSDVTSLIFTQVDNLGFFNWQFKKVESQRG